MVGEFCQWETFNAGCKSDEVVVVTSAMYGRMQAGRCASRSYGSVGCSVDLLPYLSATCSGRQTCHLVVPDQRLREMRPCPIDFAAYLEAGYKCVQGRLLVLQRSVPHLHNFASKDFNAVSLVDAKYTSCHIIMLTADESATSYYGSHSISIAYRHIQRRTVHVQLGYILLLHKLHSLVRGYSVFSNF